MSHFSYKPTQRSILDSHLEVNADSAATGGREVAFGTLREAAGGLKEQ